MTARASDLLELASHNKDDGRNTTDSAKLRLVETARNSIAAPAAASPTQSSTTCSTDEVEHMKVRLKQTAMEMIFALGFEQD